jgi:hypothetical protein
MADVEYVPTTKINSNRSVVVAGDHHHAVVLLAPQRTFLSQRRAAV